MKISIFLNGEITDKTIVRKFSENSNVLIAADGGLNTCIAANVLPDYLIGDLDSTDLNSVNHEIKIIRIIDQNRSDIQKALDYALGFDPTELHFFSIFGNRLDHHISNLLIMNDVVKSIKIFCYDNKGITCRINNKIIEKKKSVGKTISLFTFEEIFNLKTIGLKWNINKSRIKPGCFSLSNEIVDYTYSILFDKGKFFEYTLFE